MENSIINFAVVGCGRIGQRHATLLKEMKSTNLAAIVEIDPKKKETLPLHFSVPVFNSVKELVKSKLPVDVLNVCTPNGIHIQNCVDGLENNFHVLCEKPFGLTYTNCKKVLELSHSKNKKVFCVMQNRYSPPSKWLKGIVNKLGNIYQVYINCFWNRNEDYYTASNWKGSLQLDGGPLYTQFSHFLDTLIWIFGDVSLTTTKFSKHKLMGVTEFEDTGSFNFNINKGGVGQFNYSTAVHQKNMESSITILAENGAIKIGGQYMEEVIFCEIKDYNFTQLPPVNEANNYGNYKGSAANHQYVFENVVHFLNGKSAQITTGEEGLKVVQLIEAIYKSRKMFG